MNVIASQPAIAHTSSPMDLFHATDPVAPLKPTESASSAKPTAADPFTSASVTKPEPKELTQPTNPIDPFASVPLNNFEDSDLFGTANSTPTDNSNDHTKDRNQNNTSGNIPAETVSVDKKNYFQVKSGIWADSLSRGLIDLNISARKFTFTK